MIKQLIRKMADGFGYEIKRRSEPTPRAPQDAPAAFEQETDQQIRRVREYTMLSYARLHSLYRQAVYCEEVGLAGSFVECGTWKGGAVGLMALANLAHGRERRPLHLFDSFESIPEPDEAVDGAKAAGEARASGGGTQGRLVPICDFYQSKGTLQVNRQLLEEIIGYEPQFLHYHPGWFQDTLPQVGPSVGPIAILRLDGDWYASTKVCLEHLFHQVVSGGFVIIDDYGCYEGCRKAVDEFLREARLNPFLHWIDDTGRYWVKP
jgi:hypothetical protein